MLNFEVRCGMTKEEFDLRKRAAELRQEAVSHYKWSVHCPSIESNAWWQMGIDADHKSLDLERQADKIKAERPYVIN